MDAVANLGMQELKEKELTEIHGGAVLLTIGGIAITSGFIAKCVGVGFTAGVAIGVAYCSKYK